MNELELAAAALEVEAASERVRRHHLGDQTVYNPVGNTSDTLVKMLRARDLELLALSYLLERKTWHQEHRANIIAQLERAIMQTDEPVEKWPDWVYDARLAVKQSRETDRLKAGE